MQGNIVTVSTQRLKQNKLQPKPQPRKLWWETSALLPLCLWHILFRWSPHYN